MDEIRAWNLTPASRTFLTIRTGPCSLTESGVQSIRTSLNSVSTQGSVLSKDGLRMTEEGGGVGGGAHCDAGANFWSCVFELMARKGSI
jgi:hypothetical protein